MKKLKTLKKMVKKVYLAIETAFSLNATGQGTKKNKNGTELNREKREQD